MNFDTGYKEKNAFFKRIAETAAAPVKALSKDEVRLVSALKKQHLEFATIYAEMHREIHFLECKYAKKCDGFFKKVRFFDILISKTYKFILRTFNCGP